LAKSLVADQSAVIRQRLAQLAVRQRTRQVTTGACVRCALASKLLEVSVDDLIELGRATVADGELARIDSPAVQV